MKGAAAASLMFLVSLSVSGEAHPSREVKRVEAHVFGDRIVIFLRYEVTEPRHSSDLRERFDTDGDRDLSGEERQSVADYVLADAIRDLRIVLNGRGLDPSVTLKASSGLDRPLPSSYPVLFYWRLDFDFPEDSLRAGEEYLLGLEDSEGRWNSGFTWTLRLAPGVQYADTLPESGSGIAARSLEFPKGGGSFKIPILFQNPMRYRKFP